LILERTNLFAYETSYSELRDWSNSSVSEDRILQINQSKNASKHS